MSFNARALNACALNSRRPCMRGIPMDLQHYPPPTRWCPSTTLQLYPPINAGDYPASSTVCPPTRQHPLTLVLYILVLVVVLGLTLLLNGLMLSATDAAWTPPSLAAPRSPGACNPIWPWLLDSTTLHYVRCVPLPARVDQRLRWGRTGLTPDEQSVTTALRYQFSSCRWGLRGLPNSTTSTTRPPNN